MMLAEVLILLIQIPIMQSMEVIVQESGQFEINLELLLSGKVVQFR